MSHVVVVIGGGSLSPRAIEAANDGWYDEALVIAADSGLDHAVEAGLRPGVLVGDLDSISAAGQMWAYANEVDIQQFPTDKDLTDTELALAVATERAGDGHVLLLGGLDDTDPRLDHLLGTLSALGNPALGDLLGVRAVLGGTECTVVHGGRTATLELEAGRTFSLLALHGRATGVTVSGAKWTLTGADLEPTEARGISNVATGTVRVAVGSGVVTAVTP
jgi:thiamine pyrophosphokinase